MTFAVPTVLEDPRDGLSEGDRKLVENVEQYGFHWIRVGQSEDDEADFPEWREVPEWSYTVGLYSSYDHAELVVFELDDEITGNVFWDLAREIQAGRRFDPGRIYDDALPSFEVQRCAFDVVAPEWIPTLFGYGRWFYKGADFPVLQYLWPDRNGLFIWEEGAAGTIRDAQPALAMPPEKENAPPPLRSG